MELLKRVILNLFIFHEVYNIDHNHEFIFKF